MVDFLNSSPTKEGRKKVETRQEEREINFAEKKPIQYKADPFDPAPLMALFKQYSTAIDTMINGAEKVAVKDDAGLVSANDKINQSKKIASTIEKKRVEVKAPYLKVTAAIDGFCKALKDKLLDIPKLINKEIKPYLIKKEKERVAAEKKAKEDAAKLQKELPDDAPVVVAEKVPDETVVKTDAGTTRLKSEWVWDITDFKKLPAEAFEARKKEVTKALTPYLNAQVKAGIRKIAGVNVYEEQKVVSRSSSGGDMKF